MDEDFNRTDNRDSLFFRVIIKTIYILCWSVAGFFVGLNVSLLEISELAHKNAGIQILISSIIFTVIGLFLPWNVIRRMRKKPISIYFILGVLIITSILWYVYAWFLVHFSEFLIVHLESFFSEP
jgi:cation transport ATPase